MINMKMSDGGRVVIPVEIRQSMGLKEGDTVLWELRGGEAVLTTRVAQMREAQAMVRQFVPAGVSLVDELIADRRAENARDEAA
jgi:AbrB family looped-hinge helix DNA binding protein